MTLALEHSSLVNRLIVIDIAPRLYDMTTIKNYIGFMKEIEEKQLSRHEAIKFLGERLEELSIGHFLLTNYMTYNHHQPQESNRIIKFHFRIPLNLLEDSLDILKEFPYVVSSSKFYQEPQTFPCFFIYGTRSSYIKVDQDIPLIHYFFPNAHISTLDAGHWLHVEKSHSFLKLVTHFLQQTPSSH